MMARRQSDEEFKRGHSDIRRTIKSLCDVYDAGNPYIAFTLATEINNFLTTGDKITSVRKDKKFTSPKKTYGETNVLAEHKLIDGLLHGHSYQDPPWYVEYIPPCREDEWGVEEMDFTTWWNRDVVWRASAAPDQSKPNRIPANEKDQVPKPKRATYSRREIITLVRNKLGAHLDRELPEDLDNLQISNAFGIDIQVKADDGSVFLSTAEGTLPMTSGPLAAMVRQIEQEVLDAFPEEPSIPVAALTT